MRGKDLIAATLFGGAGGSSGGGGGSGGWPEVPDDGATYLFITLQEGRTSPRLGVGVNGTVTVDWGDGTEPDVLTGTNANFTIWTPVHNYNAPGDYVIRLTAEGAMTIKGDSASPVGSCLMRHDSPSDKTSVVYQSALRGVKIGNKATTIGNDAFRELCGLEFAVIPNDMENVGKNTFYSCSGLTSVDLPARLSEICNYMFRACYKLGTVTIPESVERIGEYAFYTCYCIASITIPVNVNYIGQGAFYNCHGVAYYDFTACTAVPTLANTNAFNGIAADCEIRVPAALYDEWIAATNWATYASQIKAY